ncbi:MAG TPA: hypothetical protein VFQ06_07615, partial [Nitrospira sp.]|nr:hypothetical protein [Nitrospira sp.]
MRVVEWLKLSLAGCMLIASTGAYACTCCGLDDTWRSMSVTPGTYEADIVDQLQLGPGRFRPNECRGCDVSEEEWSVSAVERKDGGFIFRTDVGSFVFRTKGAPEYRKVDITFITQPDYALDDSADIYHEIVFQGSFE